jgi:hypothetical protein
MVPHQAAFGLRTKLESRIRIGIHGSAAIPDACNQKRMRARVSRSGVAK